MIAWPTLADPELASIMPTLACWMGRGRCKRPHRQSDEGYEAPPIEQASHLFQTHQGKYDSYRSTSSWQSGRSREKCTLHSVRNRSSCYPIGTLARSESINDCRAEQHLHSFANSANASHDPARTRCCGRSEAKQKADSHRRFHNAQAQTIDAGNRSMAQCRRCQLLRSRGAVGQLADLQPNRSRVMLASLQTESCAIGSWRSSLKEKSFSEDASRHPAYCVF